MRKVLLPVDGSKHSFAAARYLINFIKIHGPLEVHVANIEPEPLKEQAHSLEPEAIEARLAARANMAMNSVRHALEQAGIAHHVHVRLGDTARSIVALASELGCDSIVMGTRGLGGIAGLALGSVTRKVLLLTTVPVICVQADNH